MALTESRCSKCNKIKPIECFSIVKKRGRPHCHCKECNGAYAKRRRKEDPALFKATITRYRHTHPEMRMYESARHRAKRFGVPFSIRPSDIIIPERCPVLGIKLSRNLGVKGAARCSPSLDRIIPELGYVKGNIAVISYRANALKRDATLQELRAVADWLELVSGQRRPKKTKHKAPAKQEKLFAA